MAIERSREVSRALRTLFGLGTVAGMTDGELIRRFCTARDAAAELAFEALVRRHGPMVLRVATDVLRDAHDAEEAFQTTFLILAQRAAGISRPERLGPWLYGVVHRVALKARSEILRRRNREQRVAKDRRTAEEPKDDSQNVWPAIHEEVSRLPENLRSPIVLCYFEEMTYEAAAQYLRLTEGAVRGRLARAKILLRDRLSRRDVAPSASALLAFGPSRSVAEIGPGLVRRALQAATRNCRSWALIPWSLERLQGRALKAVSTWATAAAMAFALVAGAGVLAQQKAGDDERVATGDASSQVPAKGNRAVLSTEVSPESPARHMTLQMAIERLVHEDRDLRVRFSEIPQAQADLLIRNLCADPGVYADAQLVPYGQYFASKPGARPKFDVKIVYPLDIAHKRAARTAAGAVKPRNVVEAQYQDAVRLKLDKLCEAYVAVLEARDIVQLRGSMLGKLRDLARADFAVPADRDRMRVACVDADTALEKANAAFNRAREVIGRMLHLPPEEARRTVFRGELPGQPERLPDTDDLVRGALLTRPDLIAVRLSLQAAEAKVDRLRAEQRNDDESRPKTNPDSPDSSNGAAPNAVVAKLTKPTVRSELSRAQINLDQTRVEVIDLERTIDAHVHEASRELQASRKRSAELADNVLPNATLVRDDATRLYAEGEINLAALLKTLSEYDELLHTNLYYIARHGQNRYKLNAAVGRRLLR